MSVKVILMGKKKLHFNINKKITAMQHPFGIFCESLTARINILDSSLDTERVKC